MPSALTYPGVYVEEIPSGVRTITGVATSVTAFIGRALKGPIDEPTDILSYSDFERQFGGLWQDSSMSFAVRDFFLNGGTHAVVVRLFHSYSADAINKIADAAEAAKTQGAAKVKEKASDTSKALNEDASISTAAKTVAVEANKVIAKLDDNDDTTKIDAAVAKVRALIDTLPDEARAIDIGTLKLRAASPGKWGGYLRVQVEEARGPAVKSVEQELGVQPRNLFNLTVTDSKPGGATESHLNLNLENNARRVDRVLATNSKLIAWNGEFDKEPPASLPDFTKVKGDSVGTEYLKWLEVRRTNPDPTAEPVKTAKAAYDGALEAAIASVDEGAALVASDFLNTKGPKKGLQALEKLFTRNGIFNLLCIPPYKSTGDVDINVIAAAGEYCEQRRAMLLVDAPSSWKEVVDATTGYSDDNDQIGYRGRNGALFFPRLLIANPLRNNQIEPFVPCGTVAGIFSRTDTQRGVWKAPAGLDASLIGVSSLSRPMTDEENGLLNPLGINCLRTFPVYGRVIWGARTLRGADDYADEYKYIPVRRTALFIEESLYRGLKWVVFEPNDEPLWAQIRLNVGAFMHNLFRQGAFQGASKREAYFVKCDAETTTQNDINLGTVNIHVGFAPLKPAEFVVIKLQQMIGQIET